MTIQKRLRVIWAALTQEWSEDRCKCGASQLVSGERWSDPVMCVSCEAKKFDEWMQDYQASKRNQAKGAA